MNPDVPRGPLTRGRIIAVALEIIDADGPEGLSMRRLGQRLGVDPMAVYYHVPNKAALYDGVVEELWGGLVLPASGAPGEWRSMLHRVFSDFRSRLLEHPRAVVLIGSRPATSAAMLRLIDDALGRLEAAGLAGVDAMQLIDCLSGYTIGKVLAEAAATVADSTAVAQTLGGLTPDSHPHVVGALVGGYGADPGAQFDRGLTALLDGWRSAGASPFRNSSSPG